MANHIVWCRTCGLGIEVIAGNLPDKCPAVMGGCGKPGRWTTQAPAHAHMAAEVFVGLVIPEGEHRIHPTYLSQFDRYLLKALRIAAWDSD